MKQTKNQFLWLFSLVLLFAVGAAVRFSLLDAAHKFHQFDELPFTLESALHFRLHEMVYLHGELPAIDHKVEFPHGVEPAGTYSISSEYVFGWLARCLPDSLSLTRKIRILQVLWFCLGIPAVALVIARALKSRWCGWLGGLLYAVSLAAVIRSTGLEISRENFAIPFVLWHLACWIAYLENRKKTALLGSAISLAAAMMSWDLIQYYLILWVVGYGIMPQSRKGNDGEDPDGAAWMIHAGWLLLAGWVHPYLRSHAFGLSIGMLLLYGVILKTVLVPRIPALAGRRGAPWAALVLPVAAGLILGRAYSAGYGHFGELLVAKIRFLNVKPDDPALLTYAQRIMWVPALHSADWRLTTMLFPTTVFISLVGVALTFASRAFNSNRNGNVFLLCYAVSLVLFILFVRFHVFLIVFCCLFAVLPIAMLRARSAVAAGVVSIFILGSIALEAAHTLNGEWGRKNVYYPELVELTDFMDDRVAPQPVLANFGVSASILSYGRCPILLHPKFETAGIRNRVRDYAEVLFKGTELEFRDWADSQGAQYYVHAMGSYASVQPEYQMRYFVDALDPDPEAAAWRFEQQSDSLRYFQRVFSNRKYQVYKMVTGEMEQQAASLAIEASRLEKAGDRVLAYEKAQEALTLFPFEPVALRVADRVSVQPR